MFKIAYSSPDGQVLPKVPFMCANACHKQRSFSCPLQQICLHCHSHQTFQGQVEELRSPNTAWRMLPFPLAIGKPKRVLVCVRVSLSSCPKVCGREFMCVCKKGGQVWWEVVCVKCLENASPLFPGKCCSWGSPFFPAMFQPQPRQGIPF